MYFQQGRRSVPGKFPGSIFDLKNTRIRIKNPFYFSIGPDLSEKLDLNYFKFQIRIRPKHLDPHGSAALTSSSKGLARKMLIAMGIARGKKTARFEWNY